MRQTPLHDSLRKMIKMYCFRNCVGVAAVVTAAALLFISCSGHDANRRQQDTLSVAAAHRLAIPDVPRQIVEPELRAAYLARHFWDSLDFTDRSLTGDTAFMEQNFANYTAALSAAPRDSLKPALTRLMELAAADGAAIDMMAGTAAKYLYDYNSPLHDEDLYIAFADALVDSPFIPEIAKTRTRYLLDLSLMNRPGMKANDFEYRLTDGTRHRLSDPSRSKTILMFFDIDCDVCAGIIAEMKADTRLTDQIASGNLRVLAVYVAPRHYESGGNESATGTDSRWLRYAADNMPPEWSVGKSLTDIEDLYDLRVLPVRYLLSPSGTVLQKDL